MTLQQLRDKANPVLADFWTALQTKQAAFHAKHGKYFQLLVSPETTVVDGADSDFAIRIPPHRLASALDVDLSWATKIPFQLEVHEWVGPQGTGYRAIVRAEVNGKTYQRMRDSDQNDTGWNEMTADL